MSSKTLANTPTRFHVTIVPQSPFLVVPEVSSERRAYAPIAWMEPPTIPSNLVRVIDGASKPLFGLLMSSMHMAWLRQVGGRLKSDYRYSIGLVYNTFPVPPPSTPLAKLEPLVDAILQARSSHPDATLAQLYDPDLMPLALRKAHQALDRAVDGMYRSKAFASELERVEHLFILYERMVAPIEAAANAKLRPKKLRHARDAGAGDHNAA